MNQGLPHCKQNLYHLRHQGRPFKWINYLKYCTKNNDFDCKKFYYSLTFLDFWCWEGLGQEDKGTTEDEMAGWHHRLDGRKFEWTLGVGDGQGGLGCCDSWGCGELDMTEWLNWTELNILRFFSPYFWFQTEWLFTFWHVWQYY